MGLIKAKDVEDAAGVNMESNLAELTSTLSMCTRMLSWGRGVFTVSQ